MSLQEKVLQNIGTNLNQLLSSIKFLIRSTKIETSFPSLVLNPNPAAQFNIP